MSEDDTEIKRQRGDGMRHCTVPHVAEERKEGAMQSQRAQRLEGQLTDGDYLLVNFSVSSVDECLCNECVDAIDHL